jgi:hypothetical protein
MKPSRQKNTRDFYSGDVAILPVPQEPAAGAPQAEIDAYVAKKEERERMIKIARETGEWGPILVGEKQPKGFTFRPLPASAMPVLLDMQNAGVGGFEVTSTAFRIALVAIDNFPKGVEMRTVGSKKFDRLADVSFFDKAGVPAALASLVMLELGNRCMERAMSLDPL